MNKIMKIFILEDNKERINFFKEKLNKHDLFITDNVYDAIEYIDKSYKEIDLYFLDHDLGDEIYVNTNDYNTGTTLAKHIKTKEDLNGRIIIHSMNYFGAQEMMIHLPQAEYIPMILLMKKL